MRHMESFQIAKLTIKFLKEYGAFDDYLNFFRQEHPEYYCIRDGFHIYLNNQFKSLRYRYFDHSVGHSIIFKNYAWFLNFKKSKDIWGDYYTICDVYNIWMDENGCNNATIIDEEDYIQINNVMSIW